MPVESTVWCYCYQRTQMLHFEWDQNVSKLAQFYKKIYWSYLHFDQWTDPYVVQNRHSWLIFSGGNVKSNDLESDQSDVRNRLRNMSSTGIIWGDEIIKLVCNSCEDVQQSIYVTIWLIIKSKFANLTNRSNCIFRCVSISWTWSGDQVRVVYSFIFQNF